MRDLTTPRMRRPLSRRLFLVRGAHGLAGIAFATTALAACAGNDDSSGDGAAATPTPSPAAGLAGTDWHRVNLGSVSAYVLAADGDAVVLDTGTSGSADDIEALLRSLSLGWDAVGHVIVTHRHGDHAGSLPEVLARAPSAVPYAGAGDLDAITSPRPVRAVGDGDRVRGLEIIETPGHTAGHISVLDGVSGVLVAGDALNGSAGGVSGPNPRFTADMDLAWRSVARLGERAFEVALFGHGEPLLAGAGAAVSALRP